MRGFEPYRPAVSIDASGRQITLSEALGPAEGGSGGAAPLPLYGAYSFTFDRVYGPSATQEEVYAESARPAVLSVLAGYNASIVAYGQTGTGKTHTMEGGGRRGETGWESGPDAGAQRGIVPRAIEDLFEGIARVGDGGAGDGSRFLVRASYLQIYNEAITDLLKPGGRSLAVREARTRGVHVDGLSEWVVRTPAEVYTLMARGAAARTTGSTKLNEMSSRSHAIFQLIVERQLPATGDGAISNGAARGAHPPPRPSRAVCSGKLNLVDLAGSERVHVTGATGVRLEESKKINQSLSTLGNVIAALTEPSRSRSRDRGHIPYRDSKLTRILEDSLGGNCKTTFFAMISPAAEAFSESLSTLKFANRAKRVRNLPSVNEDLDQRTLLRKYERELRRLRAELAQRGRDLVDRRLVLELEAARRREQVDKLAAIQALERQAAEISRHKATMATLQDRIAAMQSQLLGGEEEGGSGGRRGSTPAAPANARAPDTLTAATLSSTPAFRAALAAEQDRIRSHYASRLAEVEGERSALAAGAAQGERYKGLLIKQRDIMTALTERLGERDSQILDMQASLDGAGARLRALGDALDARNADLLDARRALAAAGGVEDVGEGASPQGLEEAWAIASHRGSPTETSPALDADGSLSPGIPMPRLASVRSKVSLPLPQPTPQEVKASPSEALVPGDAERLERLARERAALVTIVGGKMAGLVADLQRRVAAQAGQDREGMQRQVDYLSQLIGATAAALAPVQ